jgi:hypothetical protein
VSYQRGEMIGGKDRQAPVDESIMPAQGSEPIATWDEVGLTWADIIAEQERQRAEDLHRDRQLPQRRPEE